MKKAAEAKKQWTVLVWIAGDNNLSEFGTADIAEMKQIGSGANVDVVVQYDRAGTGGTRRYHLQKNTLLDADEVADLGETNTGDPAVAIDFFTWGIQTYPADHFLCVLWNHGSGIDETDIYARARVSGRSVGRRRGRSVDVPRSQVKAIVNSRMARALFSTTIDAALGTRAIAFDDTSRDFLDNAELARVISTVVKKTGRRIDVVGFDACMMNMIEVAYELHEQADFLVGSEEVEPGDGWPYAKVVGAAAKGPTPAKLAASVVKSYVASYADTSQEEQVTQAALDLRKAPKVTKAIDRLAAALIADLQTSDEIVAFNRAIKASQRFDLHDFVDLGDLCHQIVTNCSDADVLSTAKAVLAELTGKGGLVVASAHKGEPVANATGTAIYFPVVGDAHLAYPKLAFAKKTRWPELIAKYRVL